MKFHEKLLLLPEAKEAFDALADVRPPDVGDLPCLRVPKNAFAVLREWGEPLASYRYHLETWVIRWMYRGLGLVMLVMGVIIIVGGVVVWFNPPQRNNAQEDPLFILAVMLLIGAAFLAGGIWFFWWRANAWQRTLWIYPEGLLVLKGSELEVHPWFHAMELTFADRPNSAFITMRIFNEQYVIGGRSESHRDLCRYVERKASADSLSRVLRQISAGRAVNFGACFIRRRVLDLLREPVYWMAVEGVAVKDAAIEVALVGRKPYFLPRDRLQYPSLFFALAPALVAYWKQASETSEAADERDAPDLPDEPPTDTRITR